MPECTCHLDPMVICEHHRRIGLKGVALARAALEAAKARRAWPAPPISDNATAPSAEDTGGGKEQQVTPEATTTADQARPDVR
jgi:hypothetical protein